MESDVDSGMSVETLTMGPVIASRDYLFDGFAQLADIALELTFIDWKFLNKTQLAIDHFGAIADITKMRLRHQ